MVSIIVPYRPYSCQSGYESTPFSLDTVVATNYNVVETEVARAFASNFATAYSKWMEKQTMEEHDAKRFLSCMAVGTAAAIQIALAQKSPGS